MIEWDHLLPLSQPGFAALQLIAAFALDLTWGEMPRAVHPVVYMGRLIRWSRDRGFLRRAPHALQFLWGLGMALSIPGVFVAGTVALLGLAHVVGPWAEFSVGVYLLKSAFAVRALKEAAFEVQGALSEGDLEASRFALRSLCSRDASALEAPDISSAVVGSLAENLSDSIIAPIFFFALLGIPGAVGYRVVNTMDAIIGYRDRYEYLGKAAARLDDLLNLIPARLTALLLLFAAAWKKRPVREGVAILRRDRGKTPSPNGGWPMATMAGVLRIEVNKRGVYSLGDPLRPLSCQRIVEAWEVSQVATWTWIGLTAGALLLSMRWH